MAIKIQGQTVVDDSRKGSFQVTNPGSFTTAQRNALSAVAGDQIFNTDTNKLEIYNGSQWESAGGASTSPPNINNVVLSEDNTSGARFTSKSFTSAITMVDDGTPVSQKGIKGKVTSTFETFPSTTAVTANSVNTTQTTVGSLTSQLNSSYYSFVPFTVLDPSTNKLRAFGIQWEGGNNADDLYESTDDFENWSITSYNFTGNFESSNMFHANVSRTGHYLNFWGMSGNSNWPNHIVVSDILSNNPSKVKGHRCTTDNYHYDLSFSGGSPFFSRELRDGTEDWYGGSGNTSAGGIYCQNFTGSNADTGFFMIETASDRVVIIGRSNSNSGNDLWYKEFTDAESAAMGATSMSGSFSYDFKIPNFKRTELGSALYHKNAVFMTYRNQIIKVNNGASSATAVTGLPMPSGSGFSSTGYTTLWESPDGLLIAKQTVYNSNNSYAWSYYYSSNNSGATWVANYYPTISNQNYEKYTPDIYAYGHRAQMYIEKSSSYSAYKIQTYRLGYQDLTVTDGADLSSLNVGDSVKFSAYATADQHGKIMTITSNGNGTTTIRVRTFATVSVGDTIQATSSTGSAPATHFLVIGTNRAVTGTQSTDPGYTQLGPGTSQQITFPATFPSGNSPDTDLPVGTTLQVEVEATNSSASDTYPSNIITPS